MTSRRWIAALGLGLLAVAVAVGVGLYGSDSGSDEVPTASTSVPETAGDQAFVEAPSEFDPADLGAVKFFSLTLDRPEGLESYMVAGDTQAGRDLGRMLRQMEPVGDADAAEGSTLTAVLPDRTIITFGVDLQEGVLIRAGEAFRTEEDLSGVLDGIVAAVSE